MPENELESLAQALYASVLDPVAAAAIPDRIARWTGGATVALWTAGLDTVPLEVPLTNGPAEGSALYAQHFYRHDPYREHLTTGNGGVVRRGTNIIADDALARSFYYNEFARHFDMFHMMNTTFDISAAGTGRLGTLSVLRGQAGSGFTDDEVRRLEALVPHLKAAMSLRAQVSDQFAALQRDTAAALLDALGFPALVVAGSGQVLHANGPAELFLLQAPGLAGRGPGGQRGLSAQRVPGMRAVLACIADVAGGGPGCSPLMVVLAGQRRSVVSVSPLPLPGPAPGWKHQRPVLVTLRPLVHTSREQVAALGRHLFGFTPAEAATAAALAFGAAPKAIAEERGVGIETIRTQLRRAQEKSDAKDLRELATLLGAIPLAAGR